MASPVVAGGKGKARGPSRYAKWVYKKVLALQQEFRSRSPYASSIANVEYRGTHRPAWMLRPTVSDYCCDVDVLLKATTGQLGQVDITSFARLAIERGIYPPQRYFEWQR